jgi:hypothetical protein
MVAVPQPFETSMFTMEFNTTFEVLLQQLQSKFRSLVDAKGYKGRTAAVVNQMAALQYKMPAGRYSPLQFQIAQFTRPWIQPIDRSLTIPFDTFDELRSVADPRAVISQNVMAAANRYFDDLIISAALGTTQRGADPGSWTAETFPSTASTTTSSSAPFGGFLVADTFGSGASVGMTYNKIREARRVLEHYENDLAMEAVNLAVGSQQNSDMLGQVEVIDKRFNDKPVVERGLVTGILGCNIVSSERLQTSSTNTLRNCLMWIRGGLHLGIWKDMSTRIDNRADLESQPWQLYSMITAGAVRTQLGKVIQLNCADTTGVDITP